MSSLFLPPAVAEQIRTNYRACGKSGFAFHYGIEHFDAQGQKIADEEGDNLLHEGGEQWFLRTSFGDVAVPTNIYIALDTRATPLRADDLASITGEPVGNGYARIALATASWTFAEVTNWKASFAQQTFTASGGNWGTMLNSYLTNQVSNTTGDYLISTKTFAAGRVMDNGASLNITPSVVCKIAA